MLAITVSQYVVFELLYSKFAILPFWITKIIIKVRLLWSADSSRADRKIWHYRADFETEWGKVKFAIGCW